MNLPGFVPTLVALLTIPAAHLAGQQLPDLSGQVALITHRHGAGGITVSEGRVVTMDALGLQLDIPPLEPAMDAGWISSDSVVSVAVRRESNRAKEIGIVGALGGALIGSAIGGRRRVEHEECSQEVFIFFPVGPKKCETVVTNNAKAMGVMGFVLGGVIGATIGERLTRTTWQVVWRGPNRAQRILQVSPIVGQRYGASISLSNR
jgi:uncharacterized membrane protein YeaQ/YmgE (transglycosylase-associated protein family)